MQDHLFEACNKSDPLDPSCCNEATRSLNACLHVVIGLVAQNLSRSRSPTVAIPVPLVAPVAVLSPKMSCPMYGLKGLLHIHTSVRNQELCVCQVPGSHKHLQTKQKTTFQVLIKSHLVMKLSIHPPHDAGFQSLAPCAYLDPSSTKHLRSSSFLEL